MIVFILPCNIKVGYYQLGIYWNNSESLVDGLHTTVGDIEVYQSKISCVLSLRFASLCDK